MYRLNVFGDERTLAFCTFCGGDTPTRDHCPSRVLLDEPYPSHLPTVPACARCNSRFALDEEYFACLLACSIAGSLDPVKIQRVKVRRILEKKPFLVARLAAARTSDGDNLSFSVEEARIRNVVTKLAQGHSVYELHDHCFGKPSSIFIQPFCLMSDSERMRFEAPPASLIFPEVGSGAMQRFVHADRSAPEWIVVQQGMYRYLAEPGPNITIRMAVHEYLACYVRW